MKSWGSFLIGGLVVLAASMLVFFALVAREEYTALKKNQEPSVIQASDLGSRGHEPGPQGRDDFDVEGHQESDVSEPVTVPPRQVRSASLGAPPRTMSDPIQPAPLVAVSESTIRPVSPTAVASVCNALDERCRKYTEAWARKVELEKSIAVVVGGPEYLANVNKWTGPLVRPTVQPHPSCSQLEGLAYHYVEALADLWEARVLLLTLPDFDRCPKLAENLGLGRPALVAKKDKPKKQPKAAAAPEPPPAVPTPPVAPAVSKVTTKVERTDVTYRDIDPVTVDQGTREVCVTEFAKPEAGPPYFAAGSFNGWGSNVDQKWYLVERDGKMCVLPGTDLSRAVWKLNAAWVVAGVEGGQFRGKDPSLTKEEQNRYWGGVTRWLDHRNNVPYVLHTEDRDGNMTGKAIVVNPSPGLIAKQPK